MPRFTVRTTDGRETTFDLAEDDVFIGRVPAINDICVRDPSVSRQHAHIKYREEGYTIYDLKSLNGLKVNEKKVSRTVLKDGDRIRVGDATIEFRILPAEEEDHLSAIEASERTLAQFDRPRPVGQDPDQTSPSRRHVDSDDEIE